MNTSNMADDELEMPAAAEKKKKEDGVSIFIFILICLFAMAAWIDMFGLWVEMPILVNILPEGWQLPAYLTLIAKAGNIAPITYLCVQKFCKGNTKLREIGFSYLIILLGATCCLLLSVFWNKTMVINGEPRSVAFFVLASLLSVVDCTSAVVFLPYMARFKPVYMTAYCIGEGLSGLVPGILGLIQGAGLAPSCVNVTLSVNATNLTEITTDGNYSYLDLALYNLTSAMNIGTPTERSVIRTSQPQEPNFTVEIYFLLLFFMLLLSGASFTGLNFMPLSKKHMLKEKHREDERDEEMKDMRTDADSIHKNGYIDDSYIMDDNDEEKDGVSIIEADRESLYYVEDLAYKSKCCKTSVPSRCHFMYLLFLNLWICGISYGMMPTLLSYTSLPYSEMAYSLCVRLSTLAIPLAALLTLFISTDSTKIVSLFTLIGSVGSAYPIYLATQSPYPPLQHDTAGPVLVVLTTVLGAGIFSYTYTLIHIQLQRHYSHRGLVWCGVTTQLGSFLGALALFIPMHFFNAFKELDECAAL